MTSNQAFQVTQYRIVESELSTDFIDLGLKQREKRVGAGGVGLEKG